ncbi:hypothetical protein FHS27_003257 [Rhodopirellula rubra]|uniref:Uncharacterized protein n=1 Tax=Aporhodopirellula rubra TaxID=980271 RepID=A0A7W5DZJ7_9BACT|nr:hypothetical protein [Aporhodopirellula rubra]MBB3207436.1 hypothetical protein [Aporhodopirellula rubra]
MKYNILRSVAATLSMGLCTIASAQYGQAPQGPYSYGAPQPAQYSQPGQFSQQGQYSQQSQFSPNQAVPSSQLGVPRTQSVQTFGSSNYQAPAKWSNFGSSNSGPELFQPASTGGYDSGLPAPEQIPTPQPNYSGGHQQYSAPAIQQPAPQSHPAPVAQGSPVHIGAPVDDSYCQSCNQTPVETQFSQAASQPWEGTSYAAQSCGMPAAAPVRPQLFPWFGSFDLLFLNMDSNDKYRNVVSRYDATDPTRPYLPYMGIDSIDPDSALGYQLNFGRYFGCGQYGVGVSYFNYDPDEEVFTSPVYAPLFTAAGGGNLRASGMPQYNGATMAYWFDNGTQPGDSGDGYQEITGAGSPYTVYDIIDGRAGAAAAAGGDLDADFDGTTTGSTESYAEAVYFQARRDVDIQGLEINLFSFGLMGAQRAATMNCGTSRLGSLFGGGGYGGCGGYGGYNQCNDPCGQACQPCRPARGFGGAGGPLVRPCTGKVQIVTSHGLRWFQVKDTIDFAYDIDGRAGFTMHDLHDFTSTENDLLGYQFGSRLTYCLASRVNLNVGGKFGLYGNQAEFRHRLGTQENVAQLGAMPGLDIDYHTKETVLSTLGEFDLGLGVRVIDGLSVRGGYRVMGVTGLAMADNYSRDYSSSASASALHADSSLLLHGAYVGADFNF